MLAFAPLAVLTPNRRVTPWSGGGWFSNVCGPFDHLVNEAILLGLSSREPPVPVGVGLDALHLLSGVVSDSLGHHLLQVDDLLCLDRYVRCLTLRLARWLVHQDSRMREREALPLCARTEQ